MTWGGSFVLGHMGKKVISLALLTTMLCACGSEDVYLGELVECDQRGWATIDDAGSQLQDEGLAISESFSIPAKEGDTVTITYCGEYHIHDDTNYNTVTALEPDDCTQYTFVSNGADLVWCLDESYTETEYLAHGWTAIYYIVE